jgi:hypothetical protein
MNRSVRPGGSRMPLLLLLALAAMAACALVAAGPAAAATTGPTGPTMNLDGLRAALIASPGGLPGYFKTVLSGSTITNVPVQVLAVAEGQNPVDGSALIFFQITDKNIVAEGGLAEGMSGSPVYLGDANNPDPDDDPMIGAAAYGDAFTTNGLGLATPIEYMTSIETDYSVAPLDKAVARTGAPAAPSLQTAGPIMPKTRTALAAKPVKTVAGTVGTFVVARSRSVAHTLHPAAGTAVFVPLSTVEIGGLSKASAAYKRLAAAFAKRGVDVRPVGAGPGDSGFTTDLVPGAAVAAAFSTGDFWAAYVGTVTYSHDNVVVAFGHPADLDGPTGLDMTNANVYGIWSDSYASYKLVSLGATRGLITQDRTYGIAGELGAATPEVPVTASAAIGAGTPLVMHSNVPLWVADNTDYGADMIASACYFAVGKVADAFLYPGHALMSSSVTVADATEPTTTYTNTMDNVYDDPYDVGGWAGEDIYDMLSELQSNPNGTAPALLATTPGAVTFSATLTPANKSLQIMDFSVPGGLKHGANTIRALVRAYGEKGTHEQDITLNVPANVATTGEVVVYDSSGWNNGDSSSDSSSDSGMATRLNAPTVDPTAIPDSPSLGDLSADVATWQDNDVLNATLIADVGNDFVVPVGPDGQPINIVTATLPMSSAGAGAGTTWYVQGNVSKSTPYMRLRPQTPLVAKHHKVKLVGLIEAEDSNLTRVSLYAGKATRPFATVPVHVNGYGEGVFTATGKLGATAQTYKAVWGGSGEYIGATASCRVYVR